jgi:hypothetical protein
MGMKKASEKPGSSDASNVHSRLTWAAECEGVAMRPRTAPHHPATASRAVVKSFLPRSPTNWFLTSPLWNSRTVGMELMPYLTAVVGVGIELADFDLAGVLVGQFVDDRPEGAAWHAPLRPEIDQDGLLRLQHLGLEVVVRKLESIGSGHVRSPCLRVRTF